MYKKFPWKIEIHSSNRSPCFVVMYIMLFAPLYPYFSHTSASYRPLSDLCVLAPGKVCIFNLYALLLHIFTGSHLHLQQPAIRPLSSFLSDDYQSWDPFCLYCNLLHILSASLPAIQILVWWLFVSSYRSEQIQRIEYFFKCLSLIKPQ